jgi:acyl-CoA thioesterase-1
MRVLIDPSTDGCNQSCPEEDEVDRHSRRGTTKAFLRDGPAPGTTSVVVCVGDSITEGGGSADWVAMLRARVGGGVQFVNDGVSGDLSWNVLQRLDATIRCEPSVVILLIGTNDVANADNDSRAARWVRKWKHLEQAPTLEWYTENVSAILRRLQAETSARIAVLEIPIMGEDLDGEMNRRVDEYNEALHGVAAEFGVPCLPLHDRMIELLPPDHVPPPFSTSARPLINSLYQHHVRRRTWDEAAASNGLMLLTDNTHLGERAGGVIADLVAEFIATD